MRSYLIFFSKVYLKFEKVLELKYLKMEIIIPYYLEFFSKFKNIKILFFSLAEKIKELIAVLSVVRKQKNFKKTWFYWLLKIIWKKLSLYRIIFFFKKNSMRLSSFNSNKSVHLNYHVSCWNHYKFLGQNSNNLNICWNKSKIFFSCTLCKKVLRLITSNRYLETSVIYRKSNTFLKFKLIPSTSKLLVCRVCKAPTKIIKRVIILSQHFFLFENFLFQRKNNKTEMNKILFKSIKDLEVYSLIKAPFGIKPKIYGVLGSDKKKIFSCYCELFLCAYIFMFFRFSENFIGFTRFELNGQIVTNKHHNDKLNSDFFLVNILFKLEVYKIFEKTCLKFYNENIFNLINF